MRSWAVALVLLLAACRGDGKPVTTASPPGATRPAATPSSGSTAAPSAGVAVVKAALAATRARGTATYRVEATTVLTGGHVTMVREGSYDVRDTRADVLQTMRSEPKDLVGRLAGEPDIEAEQLDMRAVRMGRALYVQMPKRAALWIRFSSEAAATEQGFEIEAESFPRLLAMLDEATPSTAPPMGPIHFVNVPTAVAMRAVPGATSIATLRKAGVDVDALPGTVQVAVTVTGGVVTKVSFDAIEGFEEAWKRAGMESLAAGIRSVETAITLTAHGRPVSIAAPTGRVVTEEQLKGAQ